MKTVKVSELTGAALDWAVATCLDQDPEWCGFSIHRGKVWGNSRPFSPSTDWSQGGPILEREGISFRKYHKPTSEAHGKYYARICRESGTLIGWYKTTGNQMTGQTPLIAAMRCYVVSKLGDELSVPDELV